ncbi:Pol Polyprotein [Phytophthora megakarya]|uniref:Pol Polyprotein n=1 Tax=Phytophthora megakarya TaxID=4795 RepID=A0A225W7I2_9STRA|nr:Pol Polyprotein [Phytophthora megakarya]
MRARDAEVVAPPGVGKLTPRHGRKPGLVEYHPEEVLEDLGQEHQAPGSRPVEECYHTFDGVTGHRVKAGAIELAPLPEVSELLNREEVAMEDFLVELKAGEISDMVFP